MVFGTHVRRRARPPLCAPLPAVRLTRATPRTGRVAEAPDDRVSARAPCALLLRLAGRARASHRVTACAARAPQGLLAGTDAVPRVDARGVPLLHLSRVRHVVPIRLLAYEPPRATLRFAPVH